MGLFSNHYREPTDAEAYENTLPRAGIRGFWKTLGDYTLELCGANLIVAGSMLPACVLYFAATKLTGNVFIASAAALLGAFPAGAALVAMTKTAYASIRNRGYRFGKLFFSCFLEELKRGLLPGALYILSLVCTAYLILFHEPIGQLPNANLVRAMLVLFIVAVRMLLAYLVPMMTLVELPMRHYVRNSLLLLAARPKATIGAALTAGALYVLAVLLLPASCAYVLLIGFSLNALIAGLWCWPALNETLKIEEREEAKNKLQENNDEDSH